MFEESDGSDDERDGEREEERDEEEVADDPRDRTAFSIDAGDDEFAPRIALGRRAPVQMGADEGDGEGDGAGGDARRDARLEYFVGVHVTIGRDYFLALAGNISRGGLFVATHEEVPIGTHLWMEFLMPETDESLVVEGEVRWVRQEAEGAAPGFGVRFVDLEPEDHERLRALIAALQDEDD